MIPAIAIAGAPPPPRTLDELKAAIQAVLTRRQIPGAGIAIVSADGILWAGGIGKANIATGRDVNADTLFRVGSISKSFVALALLRLQEEGRIDLEAPVASIAPEIDIPNRWNATNPVRVVHVLEHTAGFDDGRFAEDFLPPGAPDMPLRAVLERFPGPQRVRWQPGTRMAYSNPGYVLAGYLIEKASGRPFEEYIRDGILRPLGMDQSGFALSESMRGRLSQGYNYRPPKPVPYRRSMVNSAGDLMSSPAEFARFVQMLLNRGKVGDRQIVRPGSLDRMEEGRTSLAAQAGLKNLYGLANYRMAGAVRRQGHSGLIAGFRSLYAYLPEIGRGYVVMMNSSAPSGGSYEIYRLVNEYVTAGAAKPQLPPVPAGDLDLNRFAGVFLPADYRSQIAAFSEAFPRARCVTVSDSALYMSGLLGEGRQQLFPVTNTTFRTKDEVEPSVAFVQSPEGKPAMAGPRGYFERVPAWQPYTYSGVLVIAFLLMLSSLLYAFAWLPRKLIGRSVPHVTVRAVPLAAVLCLAGAGLAVSAFVEDMSVLGRINGRTLSYCIFSWLFVVLGFAGVFLARRTSAPDLRRSVRTHSLLVSIACCLVAAALADWGLLGIRLWKF